MNRVIDHCVLLPATEGGDLISIPKYAIGHEIILVAIFYPIRWIVKDRTVFQKLMIAEYLLRWRSACGAKVIMDAFFRIIG